MVEIIVRSCYTTVTMKGLNMKKKLLIATVICVIVAGGIIGVMSAKDEAPDVEVKSKPDTSDRLIEIKRTEKVDKETGQKTVTETPVLDLPEQKPQPSREEVVRPEETEVDIKTYARRVLTHRWSAEVINDTQWDCFDTFMQEAHGWDVTEGQVDEIIDKTMKYVNPCMIMTFYRSTKSY